MRSRASPRGRGGGASDPSAHDRRSAESGDSSGGRAARVFSSSGAKHRRARHVGRARSEQIIIDVLKCLLPGLPPPSSTSPRAARRPRGGSRTPISRTRSRHGVVPEVRRGSSPRRRRLSRARARNAASLIRNARRSSRGGSDAPNASPPPNPPHRPPLPRSQLPRPRRVLPPLRRAGPRRRRRPPRARGRPRARPRERGHGREPGARRDALERARGDGGRRRQGSQRRPLEEEAQETGPQSVDPAAAIRAAMEASRRRAGGGGGGGGSQAGRRRDGSPREAQGAGTLKGGDDGVPRRGRPPSAQQKPRAASSVPDAEILSILAAAERGDVFGVLRLPPAPVDRRGACDWDSHPASKAGRLAMDAKTYRMRLDASDHPRAGDASRAVRDAVEVLAGGDKDARRRVLTEETRRRVDAMRRSGRSTTTGRYVSMTGIHHAAGAAAAAPRISGGRRTRTRWGRRRTRRCARRRRTRARAPRITLAGGRRRGGAGDANGDRWRRRGRSKRTEDDGARGMRRRGRWTSGVSGISSRRRRAGPGRGSCEGGRRAERETRVRGGDGR